MDETTLDLKEIIRTIKKQYRTILTIFAAFVILALLISFLTPPTYQAETTLRIKQPKGLADSLLGNLPTGGVANTKQLMSTYAEIMKSRTVVQQVIDQTQQDKEELPTYDDMLERITTQSVKDTEILNVKVTARSPEEAQTVANVLVGSFIDRITNLVRAEQSTVREFIGERLQDSKQDLEKAETTLAQYKLNEKIVAPGDETKAIVDQMSTITKIQAENDINLSSAQATLISVDRQLAEEKAGFVGDSPLIQQYKSKLADLEVQLVGLSEKYTDKHPQVTATKAAITETRSKLNTEITRIVNAEAPSANPLHQGLVQSKLQAEAALAVANAKQGAINKIIADREKDLSKLPAKEQGLARVMRDAQVAREIYVMLAKRHEEARISEVMQPTEVQVIDAAIAPDKPIRPKKLLNVVIGAILGLFAGTGFVFLREYLNMSVRTAEDVNQYLDLPVLGSIPDFENGDSRDANRGLWATIKRMFAKTPADEQIKRGI